jgi:mono/diheme cytochrome c family protein
MILFLRAVVGLLLLGLAGLATFWLLTMPRALPADTLAALGEGDAAAGERWFWAGGCVSCHAAEGARGEDRLALGGGLRLDTEFGTFVVPNVSMHPEDGIGAWSAEDFATAMLEGVAPDGRHYYPSFPYTSYARMDPGDIADLWAFWQTLPAVEGRHPPHDLAFPYSIRRGIGLWKRAFLDRDFVIPVDEEDAMLVHGRYLVEGPGHCAECHTPRNWGGALDTGRWLAGAPHPEGGGRRIPNITPHEDGVGAWSEADLAYYFATGFTPTFDVVGGRMAAVQRNLEMLDDEDRQAIAAYLRAVPPLPTAR